MSAADKSKAPPPKKEKKPEYGEPYKGGFPVTADGHRDFDKDRSCCAGGDCICCILFILAIIALIVLGIWAFATGDPRKLYYPLDYSNRMCGVDTDVKDKPYLYMPLLFLDKTNLNMSDGWCVGACPTGSIIADCICRDEQTPHLCSLAELQMEVPHCYPVVPSSDIYLSFGRCIPQVLIEQNMTAVLGVMGEYTNLVVRGIRDVWSTWWVFLVCAGACIVLCLVWLLILRFCAGCMVWTGIFLVVVVAGGVGAYILWYGVGEYKTAVAMGTELKSPIIILVIGSVLCGGDLLLILIVLALCSRISLAIQIVKVATMAVSSMKSMFFAPIFTIVLMGCHTVFVLATFCWLFSTGQVLELNEGSRSFQFDWTTRYICIFVVFVFFWGFFFLYGMTQTIISGAIHSWYYTKKDKDDNLVNPSALPLFRSFIRSVRYHTGGVALGSLLIAIIATIRVVLLYVQKQMKGSQNKAVQYVLSCCQCFLACLQKLIEYMSKNAYIMMALNGKGFCVSAKDAFNLIMRNILRVSAITGVGEFMIFAGKLVVALLCGLLSVLIIRPNFITTKVSPIDDVVYWWIPALLITLMSFFMASAVFTVYGFTMDTLFFDFVEDEERARNSDGSYEPYAPSCLRSCMNGLADQLKRERAFKRAKLDEDDAKTEALVYSADKPRSGDAVSSMAPAATYPSPAAVSH